MKIAIFGSTGMVGHCLVKYLANNTNWTIHAFSRDIQKSKNNCSKFNVSHLLFDNIYLINNYDYIINCIGVTNAKFKEDIYQNLVWNAWFPKKLSKLNRGKIIHISTDAVFNKKTINPNENTCISPDSLYSKTKSLGEIISDNFFIIRTSFIGHELNSCNQILDKIINSNYISGASNIFWNGITNFQFAKICKNIIENNIKLNKITHIIPKDYVTKYQLYFLIKKHFNLKVKIIKTNDKDSNVRILKTLYPKLQNRLWNGNILSIEEMISDLRFYDNISNINLRNTNFINQSILV